MGKMKELFIEEQERIESLGFNPEDNIDDEYFFEISKTEEFPENIELEC